MLQKKRIHTKSFGFMYEECPELCSNLKITKDLGNSKNIFPWKISNTNMIYTQLQSVPKKVWIVAQFDFVRNWEVF